MRKVFDTGVYLEFEVTGLTRVEMDLILTCNPSLLSMRIEVGK